MEGKDQEGCAEFLVDSIASITADYEPLNLAEAQAKHSGGETLILTIDDVLAGLKSMNVPRGLHSDDPPRELLLTSRYLFAVPMLILVNKILSTSTWPCDWKQEETTMIPKRPSVLEVGDLRPIVACPLMSKLTEHLLKKHLLELGARPNLHPAQFGSLKGLSCDHYLSTLLQELAEAANDKLATVLITWDFKVAFNSLKHQFVVQSAADLGVQPNIVCLIASYLSKRVTTVKWGDVTSSARCANGGSGQGTVWSSSLFIMSLDNCLNNLTTELAKLEQYQDFRISRPVAYCDDIAVAIHFKPDSFPRDDDGVRHFQDDGRVLRVLEVMTDFTKRTGMKLNHTKTKATTFIYSRPRVEFPPGCLSLGMEVKLVDSLKLLGVMIDRDLTLETFTADRRKKGLFATWNLQRLAAQGVKKHHLKTAYTGYVRVRSSTEYGLLPMASLLNDTQWGRIEAVQRRSLKVCLGHRPLAFGDHVPSYSSRLEQLGLPSLMERTTDRLHNFALKSEFEPRFSRFFVRRNNTGRSARLPRPYYLPIPRIDKLKHSPFYVMSEFLNTLPTTPEQRYCGQGQPPEPPAPPRSQRGRRFSL